MLVRLRPWLDEPLSRIHRKICSLLLSPENTQHCRNICPRQNTRLCRSNMYRRRYIHIIEVVIFPPMYEAEFCGSVIPRDHFARHVRIFSWPFTPAIQTDGTFCRMLLTRNLRKHFPHNIFCSADFAHCILIMEK